MSIDKFLTPNGWADDRLMRAYDLIWEVQQLNKAIFLDDRFKLVLGDIEWLSTAIANARAESADATRAAALDTLIASDADLVGGGE